jgi:hypothetical protein
MDLLTTMRHFADPVGHYARPELLWLGVDSREKKYVRRVGDDAETDGLKEELKQLRETVEKLKEVSDARTQKDSRLPRKGNLLG